MSLSAGLKLVGIACLNSACWFADAIGQQRLTIIDMSWSLTSLWLRLRRYTIHEHLSQVPHLTGQSSGHRWCALLPPLNRTRLVDCIGQCQAEGCVRQHEVVIGVEQS